MGFVKARLDTVASAIELFGLLLISLGIGLIYLPAAFIFFGAACVYAGVALEPLGKEIK